MHLLPHGLLAGHAHRRLRGSLAACALSALTLEAAVRKLLLLLLQSQPWPRKQLEKRGRLATPNRRRGSSHGSVGKGSGCYVPHHSDQSRPGGAWHAEDDSALFCR